MISKNELTKLQALCAKKEYCIYDIRQKALKMLDGDIEAAEELVNSLVEDKFVDDQRYSIAFARDKSALNGWGPIKISQTLKAKKISTETIKLSLEEISSEKANAKLQKLLVNKARSLEGDPYIKFKLIKYALSRGYEYDAVNKIINNILE